MQNKKIILRADGNSIIGLGHIYRMLALAEMLKDDFECVFAISQPAESIKSEIQKLGINVIELDYFEYKLPDKKLPYDEILFDLNNVLEGNEIVVIDGYWFGTNYQKQVKKVGSILVCIDDFCSENAIADVIINHAPNIDKSNFSEEFKSKFYLGLDYAIIRKPFFQNFTTLKKRTPRAYISLGGSDYYGYSFELAKLLIATNYFDEINVLCNNNFDEKLLQSIRNLNSQSIKVKLHFNLNATQIVDLLKECTHAFVSASTVLFEVYSRGLKCFAGYYTNNQKIIYDGYTKHNLAFGLGLFSEINLELITNSLSIESKLLLLQQPLNSIKNILGLFRKL